MVESQTLQLLESSRQLNEAVVDSLSKQLLEKGYDSITPPLLSFLGVLECGINYASEIARNLGVTRQMVAKTVKELCRLGYLEQEDGTGRQKKILFTERGEQLMSDARLLLADMDKLLLTHSGETNIQELIAQLKFITSTIEKDK